MVDGSFEGCIIYNCGEINVGIKCFNMFFGIALAFNNDG